MTDAEALKSFSESTTIWHGTAEKEGEKKHKKERKQHKYWMKVFLIGTTRNTSCSKVRAHNAAELWWLNMVKYLQTRQQGHHLGAKVQSNHCCRVNYGFVIFGLMSQWADRIGFRIRSCSPLIVSICLYKLWFVQPAAEQLHLLKGSQTSLFQQLYQDDRCAATDTCEHVSFILGPHHNSVSLRFFIIQLFPHLSVRCRPPTHHPLHNSGFPLLPPLSLPSSRSSYTHPSMHTFLFFFCLTV